MNLRGLAHVFESGPARSTLPITSGRRTNQLRALCSCAAAHGQAGGSCHRSTDPAAVFATISHDPGAALGLSDDLPLRLLGAAIRSEEHTSELQSLMRISYAVFCLKKKKTKPQYIYTKQQQTTTKHNTTTAKQY